MSFFVFLCSKGIDLYLESLALLNRYLQVYSPGTTIVAFIITSAPTRNFNIESLAGQTINRDIKDTVNQIGKDCEREIYSLVPTHLMGFSLASSFK
jgi:hypothetical protein